MVEKLDAGKYCTNCEAFHDHSVPVNTGHATNGDSGCPDCRRADTFKYVVDDIEDRRSVTGGFIPRDDPEQKITVEKALRSVDTRYAL